MSDIRVHGTSDPAEIAAVLAVLGSGRGDASAPDGIAAWRLRRRAALAGRLRPTEHRAR